MEPADQTPLRGDAVASSGELIFENGKPSGARRALQTPATVIGRAAGCDIRLKGGGVEPAHCLLVHGPDGLQVRDLRSAEGTFVNGNRVAEGTLHDGDTLQVGAYVLRLRLAAAPDTPTAVEATSHDALRVQAAAVAAQQTALGEEEIRLHHRLDALAKQEDQLSAHLEEKRRKLVQLSERAQHERTALEAERTGYEQYVKRIGGDLSDAQRELLEQRQQVEVERRRLVVLRGRLQQRWQRQFAAEQKRLQFRAEELANEDCNLKKEAEALTQDRGTLAQERLAVSSQYELGRRQIQDAWTRLCRDRASWRRRRSQERAALRLLARELETQRLSLSEAEQLLRNETEAAHTRRESLDREVDGLSQRVRNQRDKIHEQQLEINRLDAVLRARQTPAALDSSAAQAAESPLVPAVETGTGGSRRVVDLDRLASELADQRFHLAEQWQRLAQTQHRWEQDRADAAAELEALVRPLQEQEQSLAEREHTCRAVEEDLQKKHRELVQMRQHLVGWRARLRACEATWEGERKQLLGEIRHREKRLETHLTALADIRQRLAEQRRQELEKLQTEQAAADTLRREYLQLRQEWLQRYADVEEEKRLWAEKALALEQFQQEVVTRSGDAPAARRRVERLRRRWLMHNAAALRTFNQQRQAVKTELAGLETRHDELRKLADEVRAAEMRLTEQNKQWEQLQTDGAARSVQLQHDLNIALSRREYTEQQLEKMKEEIEQVARTLLEEPETCIAVDKAA
jgi:hypothetical protein